MEKTFTTGELITALQQLPPDTRVFVNADGDNELALGPGCLCHFPKTGQLILDFTGEAWPAL